MQRVKLLKASAKGSPGSLFGSPQHSASEVDGVVFDGLELGPELQFLFTSGAAPSPSNSGSDSQGHSKEYEEACREFGSAEPSPTKQRKQRRTALRLQTSSPTGAGPHGALSGRSGCTADSAQDAAATPDSRAGRRQPQRRAAALAAQITAQAAADEGTELGPARGADSGSQDDDEGDDLDLDMELDYDSDGLPCPGKPAQKRQRRRVVVEARDPSGRLYTAAEIRRMKRRITNRESARRMRLKRQEEWGFIKQQMRGMRDQTNAAVAAHKAAQAQVAKLEGQAAHWQNLWRSAAAGNAKLQQRVALLQDALAHGAAPPPAVAAPPPALPAISTVRFELEPGLPSPGALGGDLLADALLEDVGGLSETPTGMGRSHSAALPASPFSGLAPVTSGGRRAASAARGPLDLAPVFAGAAPPFASSVSAPAPSPLGAASPAGARPPRAPPAAAPKSDPDTMDELRPFADGPYDAFFAGL